MEVLLQTLAYAAHDGDTPKSPAYNLVAAACRAPETRQAILTFMSHVVDAFALFRNGEDMTFPLVMLRSEACALDTLIAPHKLKKCSMPVHAFVVDLFDQFQCATVENDVFVFSGSKMLYTWTEVFSVPVYPTLPDAWVDAWRKWADSCE